MNHNQQLQKETQHPTSKYDYDGITGVWLLIPPKFHLLILAVLLPLILWVFPHINFKGNFRYIFADYRYYLAGGISLFFIASALLSIVKAKQVRGKVRPTNNIGAQVIPKKGGNLPKRTTKSRSTVPLSIKNRSTTSVKAKTTNSHKSKNTPNANTNTGKTDRVILKKSNDGMNGVKKEKTNRKKNKVTDQQMPLDL